MPAKRKPILKRQTLSRILPFALFIAFIGAEEALRSLSGSLGLTLPPGSAVYLYPLRVAFAAAALAYFWKSYGEITFSDLKDLSKTFISIISGFAVFVLWINMDWDFARFGSSAALDPGTLGDGGIKPFYIAVRLMGSALVVPLMEEIFWRSFLIRYIDKPDFLSLPVGRFSLLSFALTAVLFGLEHNMVAAGIMAGAAYNALLYKTRSVAHCVLAHSVTNLSLGIYVIWTGSWNFW